MALRPVRGEPGKFIDTVTKVEYDISEMREDDKYDTVFIPAGAIAPGAAFIFFRDLAGKFLIDTNLNLQARISHGEEMIIDRVGMQTRAATGNLLPTPSDVKKILDGGGFAAVADPAPHQRPRVRGEHVVLHARVDRSRRRGLHADARDRHARDVLAARPHQGGDEQVVVVVRIAYGRRGFLP